MSVYQQSPVVPIDIITQHIIWDSFATINLFTRTCKQLNTIIGKLYNEIIAKWSYNDRLLLIDGYIDDYTMLPNGKRHGDYKLYDNKDELKAVGVYINDKLEGKYVAFGGRGNAVDITETIYRDGKLNGPKIRRIGGAVILKCNYVDGELHGKHGRYNRRGKLWRELNYNMGKYDGKFATYDDDGNETSCETYINGVLDGVKWVLDDATGEIMLYHVYSNGIIKECRDIKLSTGYQCLYEFSDDLITVTTKHGDVKTGKYTMNYEGKKHGRCQYWHGDILTEETYYVNGVLEDKWTSWYTSGALMNTIMYINGLPQGDSITYDMNTTRATNIEQYVDGKLHGVCCSYNHDGVKIKTTTYVEGYRNGITCTYWDNGNKRREYMYYKNRLHGVYCIYDQNGVLTSTRQYYLGKIVT
jgi:antitoxin component YwqK of YwqJK toxin-antitoxin module